MVRGALNALLGLLSLGLISSVAFASPGCPVDVVMVKGRVENPPPKSRVRVQLVYPKQQMGESGDVTLEDASFRIQIPFLTQSRAPLLIGTLGEKCGRKPKTVIVTLIDDDREHDRVSLDLAKDFVTADPSAYTLRSETVLHGQSRTTPIR